MAKKTIDEMNGKMLLGQTIRVDWAFKRPPQSERWLNFLYIKEKKRMNEWIIMTSVKIN